MSTAIPLTVLSEIFASKSSAETIVALLNEAERKFSFSPKKRHGNAKYVFPFWKACQHCATPFQTHNRTQAARNRTCGSACATERIRAARTGSAQPIDLHKGKISLTCSVCSAAYVRNKKHVARVLAPVCSRRCNGVFRGAAWKEHASKGRACWHPTSEAALIVRMTGPANPSWKGGLTYRSRKGAYADQPIKHVRCPQPFMTMARKDGYVMEHRLAVATAFGRSLLRTEVVHHRNHRATDNSLPNLMLFATNGEHKAYEHGAAIKPLWCGWCHSTTSARFGACACRPEPSSPFATA